MNDSESISTCSAETRTGIDWDAWAESLEDWAAKLAERTAAALNLAGPAITSRASIDRIAALERLRGVVAGLQAAEEVAFGERQRAEQLAAGVKARDLGRGVAEQIGYARKIAPTAAAHHLGMATSLMHRSPVAFERLRAGEVSEAQCQILVTRTSHLDEADAALVDAAIAPRMDGWNLKATEHAIDTIAYRIDPRAFVDRRGKAEADRRVWIRPAPDCMSIVSALLPTAQGVGVFAALKHAADTRSPDDLRGQGQLMADTLVQRITGQPEAHLTPVQINLTVSADSLLGGGDEPGWLQDYGPIAAEHARSIVAGEPPSNVNPAAGPQWHGTADERHQPPPTLRQSRRAEVWIRRILTDPITGIATNIDTRRRTFSEAARLFITIRDQHCRQPFCSSPIRHADHVVPVRNGGPTSIDNGQGLCERGNYVKDMPGWRTARALGGGVITTTPTGHRYRTRPPAQVGLPTLTRRE